MTNLRRQFSEVLNQRRPKGHRWAGLLGDLSGNITADRPGEVWVRLRQAGSSGYSVGSFANRGNVRPWYNLPVLIEMDPLTGEQYVVGADTLAMAYGVVAGNPETPPGLEDIPLHGTYHGWGGDDQIAWIHTLQVFPLRVQPSATTFEVIIQPGIYYANGQTCVLSTAITVDLSAYDPGIQGSTYLLIYLDANGDEGIVEVGARSGADLAPKGCYALGIVRLHSSGTIEWRDMSADLRFVPQDTGSFFTRLIDAPDAYTGAAGKVVVVKSTEDGVEFTTVPYTPTSLTDWDGDADPGDVDDALDQLAERVDDIEAAGHYRQFTYVVSSGDFSFVIDGDGKPVMALQELE